MSAPLLPPPPVLLPLTHSLSLSLSLTHTHTHPRALTHSLTRSLAHSHAHSLTRSLAHSLTRSLTHSLQGVGCTPWRPSGVPWSPPLLRGRRGTTAKGSDVRPGVPPVSLGLRRFCVAGMGQCALPRGRVYALASLRCPWSLPLLRGRRGTMCTANTLFGGHFILMNSITVTRWENGKQR